MAPPTPVPKVSDGSPVAPATALAPQGPASLLWCHQLKREHGFLLARMEKVVSEHHNYDVRIRSAEQAVESMKGIAQDVKQLTEAMSEIVSGDNDTRDWIEATDVRLKTMKEDIDKAKKLSPRVSELEAQYDDLTQAFQQMASNHQSTLRKIEAVEAVAQKQSHDTGTLVKKNDSSDVRVLLMRLDAMESRRKEDERKAKVMQDKLTSLEQTVQTYNSKLHGMHTHANAAFVSRDYPIPSTEASSELLQSSNPGYIQVPASPFSKSMNGRARVPFREESPALNAMLRKTIRMPRPVPPRPRVSQQNAQVPQTQIVTQSPTQTPDLDAPYRHAHIPNSRIKRMAQPRYTSRLTRSQAKPYPAQSKTVGGERPSKIVVLRLPQSTRSNLPLPSRPTGHSRPVQSSHHVQRAHPAGPSGVKKPHRTTEASSAAHPPIKPTPETVSMAQRPYAPKKPKRKRRVMPQVEDLETFLAMCPP